MYTFCTPKYRLINSAIVAAAISLMFGILVKPAFAAIYTVDTTLDSTNLCMPGDCSLRAAIQAANANPGHDNIDVAISGTHVLSLTTGSDDEYGDLDITEDVTIAGVSAFDTIINASGADRVIEVHTGVNATLSNLTITNGFLPSGAGYGSAIRTEQGSLMLSDVIISNNSTWSRGTIYAENSTVTLTNVQFNANMAYYGALMYAVNATIDMQNSGADGNTSSTVGGIYAEGSTVTILNSFFKNNSAGNLFQWQSPPGAFSMPVGTILHMQGGGTATLSDIQAYGNTGRSVTQFGNSFITIENSTFSNNMQAGMLFRGDNGVPHVVLDNITMHNNTGTGYGLIHVVSPGLATLPGKIEMSNISLNNNSGAAGIVNVNWKLNAVGVSIHNQAGYAIQNYGRGVIEQSIFKNNQGGLYHGVHTSVAPSPMLSYDLDLTDVAIADTIGAGFNTTLSILDGLATINELELSNSVVYGASVEIGTPTTIVSSTISGHQGSDAAIAVYNGATLSINSTTISNNHSDWVGGAIRNGGGIVTIANSIINNNSADEAGGGIANQDGEVFITNTSIEQNSTSGDGGALYNVDYFFTLPAYGQGGQLSVMNSAIAENIAGGNGGGIYNDELSTMDIVQSTVSVNNANGSGGGIYSEGELQIAASTIAFNTADADNTNAGEVGGGLAGMNAFSTLIKTSIVSNNQAPISPDCTGPLTSQGYLMVDDVSGCSIVSMTTDKLSLDPLLFGLAMNGGSTRTHVVPLTSPAVNAIPTADCTDLNGYLLTADQRDEPRNNACDIGSYEQQMVSTISINTNIEAIPLASKRYKQPKKKTAR